MQTPSQLPKFTDLPLGQGDPPHSAWGLYGKDDQLGTLNRLTDDIVLRAAKEEIQSGTRSVLWYNYNFESKGCVIMALLPIFHQTISF